MTTPPFALPAADAPDAAAVATPAAVAAGDPRRRMAATGAIGATAVAATLALAAATVVFEHDVLAVVARPAVVADEITVQGFRELAALPGPSPLIVAALVPAVLLLLGAGLLRRLGEGAPPVRDAGADALGAAERTMSWAWRAVVATAFLVFVLPAVLQLAGVHLISLTTGSMAPSLPAGSVVVAVRPSDPSAIRPGTVVVIALADGSRVTHRVVGAVRGPAGEVAAYRTRGDAVARPDPEPVPPAEIAGIVVAGFPVVGALRAWMASPLGIALGLVLAWAFAGLGVLFGDDRRRALAAAAAPPPQAVARSTSRPTS
jgi:signal peptidase